jgi:hypothetical protein
MRGVHSHPTDNDSIDAPECRDKRILSEVVNFYDVDARA